MTLVTFKTDIFPYCKGDTVDLNKKQLEAVGKVAKQRDIETPYVKGAAKPAAKGDEEKQA